MSGFRELVRQHDLAVAQAERLGALLHTRYGYGPKPKPKAADMQAALRRALTPALRQSRPTVNGRPALRGEIF
jgi:hypothetical protein